MIPRSASRFVHARSLACRFLGFTLLTVALAACGSSGDGAQASPSGSPAHDDGAGASGPDLGPGHDSAGSPDAATGPTGPAADPLPSAPNDTWTWIDVPGMKCADGSDTGIGVNFTDKSTDVLVFLEGGGACWDGGSCYGGQSIATYLTGYGKTEFDTDPQRVLFATTRDASNPFRDMNMIYVPYCTGDVHAGDKVSTYSYLGVDHPTYHVGGRNLDIVLSRVAATFPQAARVWVAGDSAGGFGAALSVPRARAAFPKARLGILDDSGQPVAPTPGRWDTWRAAWNLASPAGCAACDHDPAAYVPFYKAHYADVTFALLSYQPDPIISAFMGISLSSFSTELDDTLTSLDAGGGKTKYFVALGVSHVVLTVPTPALSSWLQQAVDDSPSWTSQRP